MVGFEAQKNRVQPDNLPDSTMVGSSIAEVFDLCIPQIRLGIHEQDLARHGVQNQAQANGRPN